VREADELEVTIEGAMNIPLGLLIRKTRHGDLDDLKRKKIVTYCSGGYRGNIAADELNKLGFDTAHDMKMTKTTLQSIVVDRPEPTTLIRWEKKVENYIAMLHFACTCITYRAAGLFG
jgi:rhodanese-related sulfurtransferase